MSDDLDALLRASLRRHTDDVPFDPGLAARVEREGRRRRRTKLLAGTAAGAGAVAVAALLVPTLTGTPGMQASAPNYPTVTQTEPNPLGTGTTAPSVGTRSAAQTAPITAPATTAVPAPRPTPSGTSSPTPLPATVAPVPPPTSTAPVRTTTATSTASRTSTTSRPATSTSQPATTSTRPTTSTAPVSANTPPATVQAGSMTLAKLRLTDTNTVCYVPQGWTVNGMPNTSHGVDVASPDGTAAIQCVGNYATSASDLAAMAKTRFTTNGYTSVSSWTHNGIHQVTGISPEGRIEYHMALDDGAVTHEMTWFYPESQKAAYDVPVQTSENWFRVWPKP